MASRQSAGLLQPQGVQTVCAHSGREALDLIESIPVHVAVLDAQMPQLGGLQVIRMLRELHRATPAILLTNHLTNHLLHEGAGNAGVQRPEQAGGFQCPAGCPGPGAAAIP